MTHISGCKYVYGQTFNILCSCQVYRASWISEKTCIPHFWLFLPISYDFLWFFHSFLKYFSVFSLICSDFAVIGKFLLGILSFLWIFSFIHGIFNFHGFFLFHGLLNFHKVFHFLGYFHFHKISHFFGISTFSWICFWHYFFPIFVAFLHFYQFPLQSPSNISSFFHLYPFQSIIFPIFPHNPDNIYKKLG